MTTAEKCVVLSLAVEKTIYETLRILRTDGGEPMKIAQETRWPIVFEDNEVVYAFSLSVG